jgi:RNA polymerase sigma-70 factor, ECF subfamily
MNSEALSISSRWNPVCAQPFRIMNRNTDSIYDKAESELIARSRKGDGEAMSELFRRCYPYSIAVAHRILSVHEDSLDAVQSAYLSAFQHFNSFREEGSFKTWITRIVQNQCLMRLREPARHRVAISLDDPGLSGNVPVASEHGSWPEEMAIQGEISRALADAAARLPKLLREVFARCAIEGLSIRDTAQSLGLTVPTTKTRLFRARSLMRRRLQKVFIASCITSGSAPVRAR